MFVNTYFKFNCVLGVFISEAPKNLDSNFNFKCVF